MITNDFVSRAFKFKVSIPKATSNPFAPPANGRCLVNTLPPELLTHIFWLGIQLQHEAAAKGGGEDSDDDDDDDEYHEDSDDDSDDASLLKPDFQILVSHVCRHWRAIALDTPMLWAEIAFEPGVSFDKAREFVARSRGVPLSIEIDANDDDDDGNWDTEEEYTDEEEALESLSRPREQRQLSELLQTGHAASSSAPSSSSSFDKTANRDADNRDAGKRAPLIWGVAQMEEVLDIILPHVSRWRELQVQAWSYDLVFVALKRMAACGPAPRLEVLKLYHHADHESTDFYDTWENITDVDHRQLFLLFNGEAPSLRAVVLWGVHLDWDAPFLAGLDEIELAWHSNGVRPEWDQFARILARSPELQVLQLTWSGPKVDAFKPSVEASWPRPYVTYQPTEGSGVEDVEMAKAIEIPVPLLLPALKGLNVGFMPPAYAAALVRRLAVPALTTLSLDLVEDHYDELVSQLFQIPFSASHPPPPPPPPKDASESLDDASPPSYPKNWALILGQLTHLEIKGLAINPETRLVVLRNFYSASSNIRSLTLNMNHLDPEFFDFLIWSDNAPIQRFLPRLEELQVTGCHGQQLVHLVKSRKSTGKPLRTLAICKDDDVKGDDEEFLEENVENVLWFSDEDDEAVDDDDDDEMEGYVDFDDAEEDIDDDEDDEEEDNDDDDEIGEDDGDENWDDV